jgi:hypothetical protein
VNRTAMRGRLDIILVAKEPLQTKLTEYTFGGKGNAVWMFTSSDTLLVALSMRVGGEGEGGKGLRGERGGVACYRQFGLFPMRCPAPWNWMSMPSYPHVCTVLSRLVSKNGKLQDQA